MAVKVLEGCLQLAVLPAGCPAVPPGRRDSAWNSAGWREERESDAWVLYIHVGTRGEMGRSSCRKPTQADNQRERERWQGRGEAQERNRVLVRHS